MATREELDEKYDDCQATPDYVAVAIDAFKDLGDKEWAEELYDEGKDWAGSAEDFLALSRGSKIIFGDDAQAKEYFDQAKAACSQPSDLIALAEAAGGDGAVEDAKAIFLEAAAKMTKAADFLALASKVEASLGDKEFASEISAKAKEKCTRPADYVELAKALVKDFSDEAGAKDVLGQAVTSCKAGDEFALVASTAKELFPSEDLGRALFVSAAEGIEAGLELGNLAKAAVTVLGDENFGRDLFGKAEGMLTDSGDLLKLAGIIQESLGDKALVSGILQKVAAVEEDSGKLVVIAQKLADDADDTAAAIVVLGKAEDAVKTNADFLKVADAILQYADDEEWKADIGFQKEKRSESPKLYDDFIAREQAALTGVALRKLGKEVIVATGDKAYAKKLFANAEKDTNYFEEYMDLAACIASDLGNKEWAGKIYAGLLASDVDFVRQKLVAVAKVEKLGDKAAAIAQLKEMEASCDTSAAYIKLGKVVYGLLKDDEWARSLYKLAVADSPNRFTLLSIAGRIRETIGDDVWATELTAKAMKECSDCFECEHVLAIVSQQGVETPVMVDLYKQAEANVSSARDLMGLAESFALRLGDKAGAARLYDKATRSEGAENAKYEIIAAKKALLS